ncbi:MAG: hypothetical protein KA335_14365, partial [Ramlibacter sp.]|nr:hypothetical protein [Ramlibacter sp.]
MARADTTTALPMVNGSGRLGAQGRDPFGKRRQRRDRAEHHVDRLVVPVLAARQQVRRLGEIAELAHGANAPGEILDPRFSRETRIERATAHIDIGLVTKVHPQVVMPQQHAQLVKQRRVGLQLDRNRV